MLSSNSVYAKAAYVEVGTEEGCDECECSTKCICDATHGRTGHWYKITGQEILDFNSGFRDFQVGSFSSSSVFIPDDSTDFNSGKITGRGYINVPLMNVNPNYNHYYICEVCEEQKFTNFKEWLSACIEFYGYKDDAGVGEVITTPRPFEPGVIAELKKAILAAPTQVLTVTSNGDHAIVEFDNKESAAMQFNVVDMSGSTVKTITAQSGSFTVSGLASGIYFVKSVTNPNLQAKIVIAQ